MKICFLPFSPSLLCHTKSLFPWMTKSSVLKTSVLYGNKEEEKNWLSSIYQRCVSPLTRPLLGCVILIHSFVDTLSQFCHNKLVENYFRGTPLPLFAWHQLLAALKVINPTILSLVKKRLRLFIVDNHSVSFTDAKKLCKILINIFDYSFL